MTCFSAEEESVMDGNSSPQFGAGGISLARPAKTARSRAWQENAKPSLQSQLLAGPDDTFR